MLSPVSTRAGPETHTRVLYGVQPVLGLDWMPLTGIGLETTPNPLQGIEFTPLVKPPLVPIPSTIEMGPYRPPLVITMGDSGYISMVKGIKNIPAVYSMNREYYGNNWYAFETTFNPVSKIIHSGYELNTGIGIRPYNAGMELSGDDRLGNWMEIGLSTVEVGGLSWGAVAMKRGVASSLTRTVTPDADLPPGTGVYAWDEISDVPNTRASFIVSPDGTAVATPRTSFYVGPDGTTVPATGYRYMHSKYAPLTMEKMSAPLSYFGFEKFNSSSLAASRFQILRPDWSDVRLRGRFDTLQLFDENGVFNARVPFADGGRASFLEPFANFYPESTHGIGNARQLVPKFDINVNFNELILLRDK